MLYNLTWNIYTHDQSRNFLPSSNRMARINGLTHLYAIVSNL